MKNIAVLVTRDGAAQTMEATKAMLSAKRIHLACAIELGDLGIDEQVQLNTSTSVRVERTYRLRDRMHCCAVVVWLFEEEGPR
jgi:hypothetical protein